MSGGRKDSSSVKTSEDTHFYWGTQRVEHECVHLTVDDLKHERHFGSVPAETVLPVPVHRDMGIDWYETGSSYSLTEKATLYLSVRTFLGRNLDRSTRDVRYLPENGFETLLQYSVS